MTSWIEYNQILLNNFWDLTKQPFLHKLHTIPTSICKQHPNFRSTFIALATLVVKYNLGKISKMLHTNQHICR